MPLLAAFLIATQISGPSDFALTRDAFSEVCGDLSSPGAVDRAVHSHGWTDVAPASGSQLERYLRVATSWGDWRSVSFRTFQKMIGGHALNMLYFDVPARGRVGDGLHCSVYFDAGQGFPLPEILQLSNTQPHNLQYYRADLARGQMNQHELQWRPGIFPTHDITTVTYRSAGNSDGTGIQISGLNKP